MQQRAIHLALPLVVAPFRIQRPPLSVVMLKVGMAGGKVVDRFSKGMERAVASAEHHPAGPLSLRYLTFAPGLHQCIGMQLVRLEPPVSGKMSPL